MLPDSLEQSHARVQQAWRIATAAGHASDYWNHLKKEPVSARRRAILDEILDQSKQTAREAATTEADPTPESGAANRRNLVNRSVSQLQNIVSCDELPSLGGMGLTS